MKPIDDIRLKEKLIKAYQHNHDLGIPPEWQQNMMREIRRIGPLEQSPPAILSFQKLVWKMAPAFCIVLMIIITGMFSMDLSADTLINESFIGDPVAVIYNEIFWG
jgi:hypothetical protein